jgi:hypothetical protein
MKRVAVVLALCAGAGACGKVQAKTPAPMPTLTMPVNLEPPAVAPPADKPAASTTTRPARPTTPTPTPTPTPAPVTDAPVLQTSVSLVQLENKARDSLERAKKDLSRVKRDTLGRDAQDQYDSAKRFIDQATDAITARNFVYAASCADKAATLAGLLVK